MGFEQAADKSLRGTARPRGRAYGAGGQFAAAHSAAEGAQRGCSLGAGVKKMNMLAATMVKARK
jgi:hypothetical protein